LKRGNWKLLKIIIVDDEELIRMGLVKLLTDAGRGYSVIGCFADGSEALKGLMNSDADVVITDIRMPEMDGMKLIKAVRDMQNTIPFIGLSGYNDFEYARTIFRYGAVDYLLKPVNQSELFKCLDKIAEAKGINLCVEETAGGNKRVVELVKEIIRKEYAKELNLEELSQKVFLNPKYLSRIFKNETGINITDYLIYVRIEKAKQMMKDNQEIKIYEVANHIGYADSVFFNKIFKRLVGITPLEFKNKI
jgi:two-component system, response regulator YesN